jgi:NAD+ diphosphatase
VVREICEEVGITVEGVRYLGSQPWPFPRSLMVGFTAIGDPSTPLVPADGEIESARWVRRGEVRSVLADGGAGPGLILPGVTSIARRMLESWARN